MPAPRELATRRRKNVVQTRSFSEMLKLLLRRYHTRVIEAAQVIEESIELAREMRGASAGEEQLSLTRTHWPSTMPSRNDSAV